MRNPLEPTVHRSYILALALVLAPEVAATQTSTPAARAAAASMVQQALATQVALDRAGFSPGEIDGRDGPKTRLALAEFRKSGGGELTPSASPLTQYTITTEDVAGPFIDQMPSDMMESSKLPALTYASPLEALAEKFHSSPALLTKLNPSAQWRAGEVISVPDVEPFTVPAPAEKPAAKATAGAKPAASALEVVVSGANKSLTVREGGKVLMYAPVTIGSQKDPLPVGEWKVTGVSWNPVFNYNPDLFWDADPQHAKAKIAAGPNNPVGIVWVDINKEHFGLHGTPEPSTIGRTESHGCIRLSNWDAARLGRLVSPGTKVTIQ
jgi:lipoprotein-anchoring transpeptidase ErfK/SrfK